MSKQPLSYLGNEDYGFISYAHKDAKTVYPAIEALNSYGYRLWYDQGIKAGDDWANTIGSKISACKVLIVFITKNSVKNKNVLREIKFAIDQKKTIYSIVVGKVKIPNDLKRDLNVFQMVKFNKKECPTYQKLIDILNINEIYEKPTVEYKDKKIVIKEKHKFLRFVGVLLLVIALVICLFKLLIIKVPNVIGLESEYAQNSLKEVGIKSAIAMDYSDQYSYGTIIDQSSNDYIFRPMSLLLTQSLGPKNNLVTMPETTGFHIQEGMNTLIDTGFIDFLVGVGKNNEFEEAYIFRQNIPAGLVVSTANTIKLDIVTDGKDIKIKIKDQTIIIPGNEGEYIIRVAENGKIDIGENKTNTISIHTNEHVQETDMFKTDIALNFDIKHEKTSELYRYQGDGSFNFVINIVGTNESAKVYKRLLADENGNISVSIENKDMVFYFEDYDDAKYREFISALTGDANDGYKNGKAMCLMNSIEIRNNDGAKTIYNLMSKYLKNAFFLPKADGDTFYIDYAIVTTDDGKAYLNIVYKGKVIACEGVSLSE